MLELFWMVARVLLGSSGWLLAAAVVFIYLLAIF